MEQSEAVKSMLWYAHWLQFNPIKEKAMKKTVRSIIENVLAFHSGLGEYYDCLKVNARDQRTVMLLEYLCRRESCVTKCLEEYLHDSKDAVLKLWINVSPELPKDLFCKCSEELEIYAPFSIDDVIDIALHFDNCLIGFFSILEKSSEYTQAGTLFNKLLCNAQRAEKKLVRDTTSYADI